MKRPLLRILILIIIIGGIFGGIIGGAIVQKRPNIRLIEEKRTVVSEESALTEVANNASPAVVSVVTDGSIGSPEQILDQERVIGSGFFISSDGIIVTNNHVVSESNIHYIIITADRKIYPVRDIRRNSSNDIAFLITDADNYPFLRFGDSDTLRAGQRVIAIGTILGRLDSTVSVGVISGLGRSITAGDALGQNEETLRNVIQVDAAFNPGNSGGPLLDTSGTVVGVNFALTEGAQSVGFAIPSNIVKEVIVNNFGKDAIP